MQAETSVSLDALQAQAQQWDNLSLSMDQIGSAADGSMPSSTASFLGEAGPGIGSAVGSAVGAGPFAGLTLGDYPLFQAVINGYEQVCPEMAAIAHQGAKEMVKIHDWLIRAIRRYQANEDSLTQASQNAGH